MCYKNCVSRHQVAITDFNYETVRNLSVDNTYLLYFNIGICINSMNSFRPLKLNFKQVDILISRVHNIYREGERLTAYIPCTNALRQVTPVNYRILSDLIYT